jgi:hypothetical protein
MAEELELHEAMRRVLMEMPDKTASAEVILEEIERRGLIEPDGGLMPSVFQIGSRGTNYSDMFEIIIKLRE